MIRDLIQESKEVAADSLRIYFAPLMGVLNALRSEWRRLDAKQRRVKHA